MACLFIRPRRQAPAEERAGAQLLQADKKGSLFAGQTASGLQCLLIGSGLPSFDAPALRAHVAYPGGDSSGRCRAPKHTGLLDVAAVVDQAAVGRAEREC